MQRANSFLEISTFVVTVPLRQSAGCSSLAPACTEHEVGDTAGGVADSSFCLAYMVIVVVEPALKTGSLRFFAELVPCLSSSTICGKPTAGDWGAVGLASRRNRGL